MEKVTEEAEESPPQSNGVKAMKQHRLSSSPAASNTSSEIDQVKNITIAVPKEQSSKNGKENKNVNNYKFASGIPPANSITKRQNSHSRPVPDFGTMQCLRMPKVDTDSLTSPMSPMSLELTASPKPRNSIQTAASLLRSLTPDVFAQSRSAQMKFKKSIIQTGISASEPRRQKSNNKKAKKNGVLPAGSELSQQILSLFDDDSDSPCSPGGEIGMWNRKDKAQSGSRKRKRTKTKPQLPDTNNIWLSSETISGSTNKLGARLSSSASESLSKKKKTNEKAGDADGSLGSVKRKKKGPIP